MVKNGFIKFQDWSWTGLDRLMDWDWDWEAFLRKARAIFPTPTRAGLSIERHQLANLLTN